MLLFLNKYYCCCSVTAPPDLAAEWCCFSWKMLLSYHGTTRVQSQTFCCCNFLGYLGVCETLHRRSQSRCHLSQFHTVCPLLSQSLVFLMISDDFSFRTRMGPQVTSSTPIRIPRCPQMAPRGPLWATKHSKYAAKVDVTSLTPTPFARCLA